MAQEKISVEINTYNAEILLEATLKTVTGFDEILVCGMESTYRTIEISKKYGCNLEGRDICAILVWQLRN